MTNKMVDNLRNLTFQNADLHHWTWGVAYSLLQIAIMTTPWNKIYQILLSRNYVYMLVDLEKRLFVRKSRKQQLTFIIHYPFQLIQLLSCLPIWSN